MIAILTALAALEHWEAVNGGSTAKQMDSK